MDPAALALGLRCAAFWAALAGYVRADGPEPRRYAGALVLGAVCAHAGVLLLGLDPHALRAGAAWPAHSALFVPLGVLALAPRGGAGLRERFLAAGLRALLPALALARLGCLAAGCCGGSRLVLSQAAGLCALALGLARVAPARAAACFAVGFGLLRLVLEPLRDAPLAAAAWPGPDLVAAAWLGAGVGLLARSPRLRGSAPAHGREVGSARRGRPRPNRC